MAKQLQKLELTWIGKGNEPKLEPRILIEDPGKSYGDPKSQNMLIHGDNLLALKALEQNFSGKLKCVCVDPPFNTGAAFEHYEDGVEHSIWIQLMHQRFKIFHNLLAEDGFIMVHLDDSEMAYCKILLDEVFGRNNYLNTISMTTNEPSGFKATGSAIFSTANFILFYSKNRYSAKVNKIFIEKEYDKAYSKVILNKSENYTNWKFASISEVLCEELGYQTISLMKKVLGKEVVEEKIKEYALNNSSKVFRTAAIGGGAKLKRQKTIDKSKKERDKVVVHPNDDVANFYILNGEMILFYENRLYEINGKMVPGQIITDVWTDISWTGIANEGGVEFKNGKKPEKLIRRCLELTTKKGDWVLDSFLGSATTAAVAHKMSRQWIGIELGEQAYSHCLPRLKSVTKGTDQTGVSKVENWKGGSGFKFYTLAPSLIQKDKYGSDIINPEYNANMLAAAMAKQEGFNYQPNEGIYWKQGQSSEKDFIFTTTQFITVEVLDKLHDEMQPGESLLLCCKSFKKECSSRHTNITIKKIPQMLLGRCEFGKDDYSLNIINLPNDREDNDEEESIQQIETVDKIEKKLIKKKANNNQSELF